MTKKELEEIGFRGFINPKKNDNLIRLHWSYFREAGEVLNIVLVKKKHWEIEYIFKQGEKTHLRFENVTLGANLKDIINIIRFE